MDIPIYIITAGAGLLGGAILGFMTYLDRMNADPTEKFDWKKFGLNVIPALLVGAAAGFLSEDVMIAFTAGLVGKKVWDTGKKFVP